MTAALSMTSNPDLAAPWKSRTELSLVSSLEFKIELSLEASLGISSSIRVLSSLQARLVTKSNDFDEKPKTKPAFRVTVIVQ